MSIFKNPLWLESYNYPYTSYEDIPIEQFQQINARLDQVISQEPIVSIVIPAWNEEQHVLRCISSLSAIKSSFPFEIIIVNNNSSDKTQEILDQLHVRSYFQGVQGCGPARQLGQIHAKGKYILMGDADCIYPPKWIDEMIKVLSQKDVVCVYGRYAFLEGPGFPRWKLSIFELFKNSVAEFRHLYRPYFNAYGMNMAYISEYGLKTGFIEINRRGEDGQLCLDLMKFGKVKQVRSDKAIVWTGVRTLQQDGSIGKAFTNRLKKEYKRFFFNLHSKLPDNSQKSERDKNSLKQK